MNTVLSVNEVRELHNLAVKCNIDIEDGVELVWVRSACQANFESHVADTWGIETCIPCSKMRYDYANIVPALTMENLIHIMRQLEPASSYEAYREGDNWRFCACGFYLRPGEEFSYAHSSLTHTVFEVLRDILNHYCDEQGKA